MADEDLNFVAAFSSLRTRIKYEIWFSSSRVKWNMSEEITWQNSQYYQYMLNFRQRQMRHKIFFDFVSLFPVLLHPATLCNLRTVCLHTWGFNSVSCYPVPLQDTQCPHWGLNSVPCHSVQLQDPQSPTLGFQLRILPPCATSGHSLSLRLQLRVLPLRATSGHNSL